MDVLFILASLNENKAYRYYKREQFYIAKNGTNLKTFSLILGEIINYNENYNNINRGKINKIKEYN